jgi:hypothetical protein
MIDRLDDGATSAGGCVSGRTCGVLDVAPRIFIPRCVIIVAAEAGDHVPDRGFGGQYPFDLLPLGTVREAV